MILFTRMGGNYLLKINTESGFTEEITLTVVQTTNVQAIEDIQTGDRIWLECKAEGSGYREVTKLVEYQTISYEYAYANMSLELPAGWAYEIREYDEENYTFGIDFWPENESEGKIKLEYYPDGLGVCGTGLKEDEIRLGNGLRAFKGTFTDQDTQYTVYVGADGTVQNTTAFNPNEALVAKPVIYLYPEQETGVTVKLDFDGTLTNLSGVQRWLDGHRTA